MWIIGFAEGGYIGSWPSEAAALEYREQYLQGRVANVFADKIVSDTTITLIS